MNTDFQEQYARLSDDELLHIASDRRDLVEHAAVALDAEMARRRLTHEQARSKRRELRSDFEGLQTEIARRRKTQNSFARIRSKYFVDQMSRSAILAGLAGEVVFLILLPGGHHEWVWPVIVVYMGALVTVLAVQEWVRWTVSFWIALAVSLGPEFFLARWLAIYRPSHSRSGEKGAAFLSLITGWLVGVPLFLLLEKLKPSRDAES